MGSEPAPGAYYESAGDAQAMEPIPMAEGGGDIDPGKVGGARFELNERYDTAPASPGPAPEAPVPAP